MQQTNNDNFETCGSKFREKWKFSRRRFFKKKKSRISLFSAFSIEILFQKTQLQKIILFADEFKQKNRIFFYFLLFPFKFCFQKHFEKINKMIVFSIQNLRRFHRQHFWKLSEFPRTNILSNQNHKFTPNSTRTNELKNHTLNKKGRSEPHFSTTSSPSTLGFSEIHDFRVRDFPSPIRKEGPDSWVPIHNSA